MTKAEGGEPVPLYLHPPAGKAVEALKKAREDIVIAVAFLQRDLESDRLTSTAKQLLEILAKREREIDAALSSLDGAE